MRPAVTSAAERDLSEIAAYIARHNPVRAVTFVEELREEFLRIAHRPEAYRLRPEIGVGARSAVFGQYLILFRVKGDIVQIRRILHGARDIARQSL